MTVMEERFKTFTVLMAKIRRSIQKIKAEEMSEYDLKIPHVSCLYYLYVDGEMTATELCDICDEDKAAISRSVDQLESRGLVVCRSSGSKKKYRAEIKLTESGRMIAERVAKKVDDVLASVSEGLSEEERRIFYSALTLISNNLERECQKYE